MISQRPARVISPALGGVTPRDRSFFLLGVCVAVAGNPDALLRQWVSWVGGALLHGVAPYGPHTHVFPPGSSHSLCFCLSFSSFSLSLLSKPTDEVAPPESYATYHTSCLRTGRRGNAVRFCCFWCVCRCHLPVCFCVVLLLRFGFEIPFRE